MAISRVELLADVIVLQTRMYDSLIGPTILDNYVPHFLRHPGLKADRSRVARNVLQLLELLRRIRNDRDNAHPLPDEGTTKYDQLLARVLCAILYAERRPVPLFEYLAAAQLPDRLRQDRGLAFFRAVNWVDPSECADWLDPLIRYHKFANLVLGGRLRKKIYSHIIDTGTANAGQQFPVELGLLAAATYDTPGEDQVPSRLERIDKVYRTWAGLVGEYEENIPVRNLPTKAATDRLLIAFDLPLCDYTKIDLIRDRL